MTSTPHPALIAYPAKAAFGRSLPKAKIYEHGVANRRLKDLFVKQVDQIVWQYKLAPETINLPARPGVPEVQIFGLQLKTPELHRDVLRCIDGAIPLPILFELTFEGRVQVTAAYKQPSESDSARWVASDYFSTDWLPADRQRAEMPVALHLGSLYEQLVQRLIPLRPRPQEALPSLIERFGKVQALRRELQKAISTLETEKQFNRKVEINGIVRKLKLDLQLSGG